MARAEPVTGLRSDPLFGGLTRPATMLGLPIEVLLAIFMAGVLSFLIVGTISDDIMWKIMSLGLGGVLYLLARLICARDARAFRYLALQLRTKGLHRTRSYWRSGSYSPVRHRRR
jgi:type IV secretion system protein VirB3